MKQTVKEGRLYALFGKALLLSAAAFVMLCINPLIAHAEAKLPFGSEEDGYYIDADGNMTVYTDAGLEKWLDAIGGGPGTYRAMVKTLTVNEGVTAIANYPYYGDTWDIPFLECRNLTTISLPASVTEIDRRAFYSCPKLTTVTIAQPSDLTTIGEDAFAFADALTTIDIPDGVTSIGDNAFEHTGLTSVTIPASVESIGSEAFAYCKDLDSVTMLGETPPTLGYGDGDDSVFESTGIKATYVDSNGTKKQIVVPKSSIQAYKEGWTQWTNYIYDGEGGGSETPDPGTDPDPGPGPDTPGNEGGGSVTDLDPTRKEDTADKPAYADTTIDVQAHTVSSVVYSVDVEWGAMTFRYENSIWDATAHQATTGAGWQVYDSVNDKVVDATEDAINRIQVTNHSNAEVKAALAYAGRTGYEDTTGSFAKAADDDETSYDAAAKTLTLANADNNKGEAEGQGKATVGCVYFMPSGIKEDYKTAGITKWTQLGTITVGIETADQAEATD